MYIYYAHTYSTHMIVYILASPGLALPDIRLKICFCPALTLKSWKIARATESVTCHGICYDGLSK